VGVRRVILASSATIYGNQAQQPVHEEMAPQPTVPYAVSKLAAEQFLFIIGRLAGFQTVALRIFNAYGPGQPLPPVHAPVIPQFMHQILGGGSVVVQGDGSQTRDFVYIDDVVKALMATADAVEVDQQIINIGSGLEITVNALIERIAQSVDRKANILYNRETSGGVGRLVADLGKARRLLGYTPAIDMATGLQCLLRQDPLFRPA
jgi:UDP-glucose 4-epimerase